MSCTEDSDCQNEGTCSNGNCICKTYPTVVNDVEYDTSLWIGDNCEKLACAYGSLVTDGKDEEGELMLPYCSCNKNYTGAHCNMLPDLPDPVGYTDINGATGYTDINDVTITTQSVSCGGLEFQGDFNTCVNCTVSTEIVETYFLAKLDYVDIGYIIGKKVDPNDTRDELVFVIKKDGDDGVISNNSNGSNGDIGFSSTFKVDDLFAISTNEDYIGDGGNYPDWWFFRVKSFNIGENTMDVERIDQKTDNRIDLVLPASKTEMVITVNDGEWEGEWDEYVDKTTGENDIKKDEDIDITRELAEKLIVYRETSSSSGNVEEMIRKDPEGEGSIGGWSLGFKGKYCEIAYTGPLSPEEMALIPTDDDPFPNTTFDPDKRDPDENSVNYSGDPVSSGSGDTNNFCPDSNENESNLISAQGDAQEKTIKAAMKAMGIQACKSDYACVTAEVDTFLGSADATACAQSTVGCEQVVANFANTVNAQKQISCFIKKTVQSQEVNIEAKNTIDITLEEGVTCCQGCNTALNIATQVVDGNTVPVYNEVILEDGEIVSQKGIIYETPECTCVGIELKQTNNIGVVSNSTFTTEDVTNIQKTLAVAIAHDFENLQTSVRDGERNVTPIPPGSKAMNVSSQINSTLQQDNTLNENIQEALYNIKAENNATVYLGKGVTMYGPCVDITQENFIELQVSSMMEAAFNTVSGITGVTDLGTKIKNTQEQRSTSTDEGSFSPWIFLLLPVLAPWILMFFKNKTLILISAISFFITAILWIIGAALFDSIINSDNIAAKGIKSTLDLIGDDIDDTIIIVFYSIGGVYLLLAIWNFYRWYTFKGIEIEGRSDAIDFGEDESFESRTRSDAIVENSDLPPPYEPRGRQTRRTSRKQPNKSSFLGDLAGSTNFSNLGGWGAW